MHINSIVQNSVSCNEWQPEEAIYWFILLSPLMWVLGCLHPMGVVLLTWILFKRNIFALILNPVVLAWCAVGVAQAVSVVVNWWDTQEGMTYLFYRLVSTPVSGWFILGAGIAAGRGIDFQAQKVQRAFSLLGVYILILGSISLILYFFFKLDSVILVTPLGSVLPAGLPVVRFLFTLKLYQAEEIFGYQVPRMVFFYSWFVALGFTGISIAFINLGEKDTKWKVLGIAGGLMGLFGSHSRAGVVAFLVSIFVYLYLQVDRAWQWLALSVFSIMGMVLLNFGKVIAEKTSSLYTELMDLRRGSSDSREIINEASWQGFLDSPLWGHGWPGAAISKSIEAAVGGHSTIYGLLYTGGMISFVPFCIAMTLTLIWVFNRALKGGHAERSSLAIVVSLMLLCYGEGIYSFALPGLAIFLWIGGALGNPQTRLQYQEGNS